MLEFLFGGHLFRSTLGLRYAYATPLRVRGAETENYILARVAKVAKVVKVFFFLLVHQLLVQHLAG